MIGEDLLANIITDFFRRRIQMDNDDRLVGKLVIRSFGLVLFFQLLYILFVMSLFGGAIYVAWHFLSKWW
jgi:hypothetical protein